MNESKQMIDEMRESVRKHLQEVNDSLRKMKLNDN